MKHPLETCHFTSVINWCLKVGLYQLKSISRSKEPWTAIIDASIQQGTKKAFVVLKVPTYIMKDRKRALTLQDVEVADLTVHESLNGDIIADLLTPLFEKLGAPSQILSDGGSDIAKGIKLAQASMTNTLPHSLDIGHTFANILKRNYEKQTLFNELVSFAGKVGAKLRQTLAAWITPNKQRTKGRFQSISQLANWAQNTFKYCQEHLQDHDDATQALLQSQFVDNVNNESLVLFSQQFQLDCQVLNDIQKEVKNNGLSEASYKKSIECISSSSASSVIKEETEQYLSQSLAQLTKYKIETGLLSTDVIESLFGKIKFIMARSPSKEFNKLCLLLPMMTGTFDENLIETAISEIMISDLKKWEEDNIGNTLLKEKRKNFAKLKQDDDVPIDANDLLALAA